MIYVKNRGETQWKYYTRLINHSLPPCSTTRRKNLNFLLQTKISRRFAWCRYAGTQADHMRVMIISTSRITMMEILHLASFLFFAKSPPLSRFMTRRFLKRIEVFVLVHGGSQFVSTVITEISDIKKLVFLLKITGNGIMTDNSQLKLWIWRSNATESGRQYKFNGLWSELRWVMYNVAISLMWVGRVRGLMIHGPRTQAQGWLS